MNNNLQLYGEFFGKPQVDLTTESSSCSSRDIYIKDPEDQKPYVSTSLKIAMIALTIIGIGLSLSGIGSIAGVTILTGVGIFAAISGIFATCYMYSLEKEYQKFKEKLECDFTLRIMRSHPKGIEESCNALRDFKIPDEKKIELITKHFERIGADSDILSIKFDLIKSLHGGNKEIILSLGKLIKATEPETKSSEVGQNNSQVEEYKKSISFVTTCIDQGYITKAQGTQLLIDSCLRLGSFTKEFPQMPGEELPHQMKTEHSDDEFKRLFRSLKQSEDNDIIRIIINGKVVTDPRILSAQAQDDNKLDEAAKAVKGLILKSIQETNISSEKQSQLTEDLARYFDFTVAADIIVPMNLDRSNIFNVISEPDLGLEDIIAIKAPGFQPTTSDIEIKFDSAAKKLFLCYRSFLAVAHMDDVSEPSDGTQGLLATMDYTVNFSNPDNLQTERKIEFTPTNHKDYKTLISQSKKYAIAEFNEQTDQPLFNNDGEFNPSAVKMVSVE